MERTPVGHRLHSVGECFLRGIWREVRAYEKVGEGGAVEGVVAYIFGAFAEAYGSKRGAVLKHTFRDVGDIVGEADFRKSRSGESSSADGCHLSFVPSLKVP